MSLSPSPGDRAVVDLTIFVACYNEEPNIVATLETVVAATARVGCAYEIIVVDDASRDRSTELVRTFGREHPEVPLTLVVNEVNQGLGANYIEAAFMGRGTWYRLVCGDNVEPLDTLAGILSHLGEADMVLPYHIFKVPRTLLRRVLSRVYTGLVDLLGGHRVRYYNGCGLFRRYDVMRWHPQSSGFGFQAELVTCLLDRGATYVEIPVHVEERTQGNAKALGLWSLCSVGHSLLEILFRRVAKLFRRPPPRRLPPAGVPGPLTAPSPLPGPPTPTEE